MSETQTLSWNTQFEDTRRKLRFGEKQLHDFQSIFARLPHSAACSSAPPQPSPRPAKPRAPACCSIASPPRSTRAWSCSSELDEQMFAISERLRSQKLDLPPQNVLRQQVLDRLVLQELQMQRANRAGIKVSDETLNNALRDVAEQNKITLADLPDGARRAGHRLRQLSRRPAQRARDADPAPARRDRAHQREPARDRPVPRAAEEDAVGVERVQRLAHPHRRAAGGHARSSSTKPARRPTRSIRRPPRAKTSDAWRSRTPTRRPLSKAARSAGARDRSCPPSSAKSSPA